MWDWVSKLSELNKKCIPYALATVVHSRGGTPRDIGAKMVIVSDEKNFGTIGGGKLESIIITHSLTCIQTNTNKNISIELSSKAGQCCGGMVDILIEVYNMGPSLYLFGAGHVGLALCKVLENTPFKIHLIDSRNEWIEKATDKVKTYTQDWSEVVKTLSFTKDDSYILIMTYSHELDDEILRELINYPSRYIGMIGSKSKWNRFSKRLLENDISQELVDNVHCPIGFNIGGKAPSEVAISVASELLACHYKKESIKF